MAGGLWFVMIEGEERGPMPPAGLSRCLAAGQIDAESFVWQEGMDEWLPAFLVEELASVFAPPAPAAARPPPPPAAAKAHRARAKGDAPPPGGPISIEIPLIDLARAESKPDEAPRSRRSPIDDPLLEAPREPSRAEVRAAQPIDPPYAPPPRFDPSRVQVNPAITLPEELPSPALFPPVKTPEPAPPFPNSVPLITLPEGYPVLGSAPPIVTVPYGVPVAPHPPLSSEVGPRYGGAAATPRDLSAPLPTHDEDSPAGGEQQRGNGDWSQRTNVEPLPFGERVHQQSVASVLFTDPGERPAPNTTGSYALDATDWSARGLARPAAARAPSSPGAPPTSAPRPSAPARAPSSPGVGRSSSQGVARTSGPGVKRPALLLLGLGGGAILGAGVMALLWLLLK